MSRLKKSTWKWIIPFLIMIITLILFRMIFLLGYVPTESMEPTLKKDSYIVGVRIYSKLETGDIIVFHHDGKLLVKRIAAVKNEHIEHNGISVAVPENCYYVLGDNAGHSLDSRYWEEPFVREEDIMAKLIWP